MSDDGRTLLVRKRGTAAFMQPGGKLTDGEEAISALAREIQEELGCGIRAGSSRPLGHFRAPAANEPDCTVEAQLFAIALDGEARAQAEIEELIWVDPARPGGLALAPLTAVYVMPLAQSLKGLGA